MSQPRGTIDTVSHTLDLTHAFNMRFLVQFYSRQLRVSCIHMYEVQWHARPIPRPPMGGLINPRPWRGQYRAGFSNTGGSPKPRKRAPCPKNPPASISDYVSLEHLEFPGLCSKFRHKKSKMYTHLVLIRTYGQSQTIQAKLSCLLSTITVYSR